MQDGSRLTHENLREEAHTLASDSAMTYAEIADKIGVSETAVAKALTTTGDKFQQVQRRVISLLSDYEIERIEEVFFEAVKADVR